MKIFANIMSIIFQPIFIPLIGVVMLLQTNTYSQNFPLKERLLIYAGVFLLTGVVPAIVVLIGMLTGKISDSFISHRRQRVTPYVVSIISYIACCFFIMFQGLGLWALLLMIGATLSLIIVFIINFYWKISAHMAGIGGLCGGTFASALFFQNNPIALFCILILIAGALGYSRMYLKAHTLGQVFAGFAVGFVCLFSPYIYLYTII